MADPRHIAEFLMELSVKQDPGSFLFCWSAFRSLQFLGEKEGNLILYHCISKLLEKDGCGIGSDEFMGIKKNISTAFNIPKKDYQNQNEVNKNKKEILIEEKFDTNTITNIYLKLYKFLKLYNNNYRPIYHLESFIFYLCKVIYGLGYGM